MNAALHPSVVSERVIEIGEHKSKNGTSIHGLDRSREK